MYFYLRIMLGKTWVDEIVGMMKGELDKGDDQ